MTLQIPTGIPKVPSLNENPVARRILIVEDSIMAAVMMSAKIERDQPLFRVHIAPSMVDGIKQFNEFNPDVVILDAHLPDSVGKETISKIKFFKSKGARVIIATGDSTIADLCHENSADYFIIKPFGRDSNDFLDMVKDLAFREEPHEPV